MAKLADLKLQAEKLVEQGKAPDALKLYRHILTHLEKSGAMAGEVQLYAKAGDLAVGLGDARGAVELYERAARIYVERGRADGVMAVAIRLAKADKTQAQCWFRFSRDLLRGGHIEQARLVLLDYANRFKQQAAAVKLESLRGRVAEEVHNTLERTLSKIERRERGSMQLGEADADDAPEDEPAPTAPSAGPRNSGLTIPYEPALDEARKTAPRVAPPPPPPAPTPEPQTIPPAAAKPPAKAPQVVRPKPVPAAPPASATVPRAAALRSTPAPPSPRPASPPRPDVSPAALTESPHVMLPEAPPRAPRSRMMALVGGGIGIAVLTAAGTMLVMRNRELQSKNRELQRVVSAAPAGVAPDSATARGTPAGAARDSQPVQATPRESLSTPLMARDTARVPVTAPPSAMASQRRATSPPSVAPRRVDSTPPRAVRPSPPAVATPRADSTPPAGARGSTPPEGRDPPPRQRIIDAPPPRSDTSGVTRSVPPPVTAPPVTRTRDPDMPAPPAGTVLKRPILAVFGLPIDSVVDVMVAGRAGDRVVQSLGEGRYLSLVVVDLGAGGASPRRVSASGGGSTGSLRVGSHLVTARAPIPPDSLSVLLGKLVEVRP